MNWTQIKRLARGLNLPSIHEDTRADGFPCLRAHGRLWTWWDETLGAPGFRLPSGERDFLIASDPEAFFVTDAEAAFNHVLARPELLDPLWVRGNLSLSWRALAPALFTRLFPGEGPPVPEFMEH
ncbi:hypothetical protein [Nioella nitratireducens]|uniref:hypothetical protein n=1 Tax=Nioella nitratireducens TaxID=1287720 RepID=UPI001313EC20|nr:hypothetical protein [Nioella nitratireducens]